MANITVAFAIKKKVYYMGFLLVYIYIDIYIYIYIYIYIEPVSIPKVIHISIANISEMVAYISIAMKQEVM